LNEADDIRLTSMYQMFADPCIIRDQVEKLSEIAQKRMSLGRQFLAGYFSPGGVH